MIQPGITPLVPLATTPFLTYSAADHRAALAPIAVLTIVAVRPWELTGPGITQALLLTAVPALLGRYVSARRRIVAQALADERARLADDLHDTITHRISLIVLRAGVLELAAKDDETRTVATELRTAGCQALEELQELLHVRTGETEPVVPPVPVPVPELAPLLEESRLAGIPVELVDETGEVAPVISRTVHRVVQEALTNVRKHAPGAAVRVHLRHAEDAVHVTVHDTGPTHAPDPALAATGSRAGLHNLRQRVEMIGGTLHAGHATGGGFHVDVTLPATVP